MQQSHGRGKQSERRLKRFCFQYSIAEHYTECWNVNQSENVYKCDYILSVFIVCKTASQVKRERGITTPVFILLLSKVAACVFRISDPRFDLGFIRFDKPKV